MVNIAVIGAGYLGSFHIEKFLNIDDCKLVGIVDISEKLRENLKKKYNIPVYSDYTELLNKVDAVSIVVPTKFHYEVASFFIKNHVHTFIEKPVTETIEQCEILKSLARDDLKIQVGHIERFNPVFKILNEIRRDKPKAIILRRKAPFIDRGTDVDIIFDLMIHDIDIVLSFFPKGELNIKSVDAAKVMTDKYDYVRAECEIDGIRVSFEASRVHNKKERSITFIYDDTVLEGDFINQEVFFNAKNGAEILSQGKQDILLEELKSFISAIQYNKPVAVGLDDGVKALSAAYKILSFCGTSK